MIFCISLTSTSCYVHCDIVQINPPRPSSFRSLVIIKRLGRLRLPRTLVQTIGSVTRAAPSNDCIWSRLSAGTMSNSYLSGNVLSIVFSPPSLPFSSFLSSPHSLPCPPFQPSSVYDLRVGMFSEDGGITQSQSIPIFLPQTLARNYCTPSKLRGSHSTAGQCVWSSLCRRPLPTVPFAPRTSAK